MWSSCLNNFLANPEQKGHSGVCVVWPNHFILRLLKFSVVKVFYFQYISKFFQGFWSDLYFYSSGE